MSSFRTEIISLLNPTMKTATQICTWRRTSKKERTCKPMIPYRKPSRSSWRNSSQITRVTLPKRNSSEFSLMWVWSSDQALMLTTSRRSLKRSSITIPATLKYSLSPKKNKRHNRNKMPRTHPPRWVPLRLMTISISKSSLDHCLSWQILGAPTLMNSNIRSSINNSSLGLSTLASKTPLPMMSCEQMQYIY